MEHIEQESPRENMPISKQENFTIIIPAHNAHKTIFDTLSSLALQTRKDFFIVIVLDGPDEKAEIEINKFSHLSITVLRDPHPLGPGGARNVGLEYVLSNFGGYVMFLDADDLLLPHAVAVVKDAIAAGFDMLIGSTLRENRDGRFQIAGTDFMTWLHGRAYSTAFIDKYHFRFPPFPMSEDLAWNTLCSEFTTVSPQTITPIHLQRWTPGSLSHRPGADELCATTFMQAIVWYAQGLSGRKTFEASRIGPQIIISAYYQLDYALNKYDDKTYLSMCREWAEFCRIAKWHPRRLENTPFSEKIASQLFNKTPSLPEHFLPKHSIFECLESALMLGTQD